MRHFGMHGVSDASFQRQALAAYTMPQAIPQLPRGLYMD